jgi:hypothetical protein
VPFQKYFLPGVVMPLPKYYTPENPRQFLGVETYSVIPYNKPVESEDIELYVDEFDAQEIRLPASCVNGGQKKLLNLFWHKIKFDG